MSLSNIVIVCMYRSYETVLVSKTPASNVTGDPLLVVVQAADRPPVSTKRFFAYRPNPEIGDIYPRSHLLTYVV